MRIGPQLPERWCPPGSLRRTTQPTSQIGRCIPPLSSQIPKGEAAGRRLSCRFRNYSEASRAKLLHKTIAGAEGEDKNRERGCFVSTVQENAGVAHVQVSNRSEEHTSELQSLRH